MVPRMRDRERYVCVHLGVEDGMDDDVPKLDVSCLDPPTSAESIHSSSIWDRGRIVVSRCLCPVQWGYL